MRHFVLATILVILLAEIAIPGPAEAQEPTPTPAPATQSQGDGFFSDIRFGDVLAFGSTGLVVVLAIWIVRVQSTRIQSAREELEDQRKRCADEIDAERRHSEQMRELSDKAEDLLQRRLDDAESRAGIDSTGQITADKTELPEDIRQNLSEAVTLLKEMKTARLHYEPTSAPSPETLAREHLAQGNAFYAAGEYEQALSQYSRSLELRPDGLPTLNNRGIALRRLGRQEEAIADYDRSLELRPDDTGTMTNRGTVLGQQGRYEEARADFNRSLELRPDQPGTLYNRAMLYSLWKNPTDAFADLQRAIAGDPSNRDLARTNPAFDNLRNDAEYGPRFRELVGEG